MNLTNHDRVDRHLSIRVNGREDWFSMINSLIIKHVFWFHKNQVIYTALGHLVENSL